MPSQKTGLKRITSKAVGVSKILTRNLQQEASEKRESLVSHLDELRNRLVYCVITFGIAFIVCFAVSAPLVRTLMTLGDDFAFVYIHPTELMLSYIRIALVGGIVFAFPMLGYQGYRFMCPGLTSREKKACFGVLTAGVFLFVVGAFFCYRVVLPISLHFLAGLDPTGTIKPTISIENYMSFVLTMLVVFGCVFELPIVTILLTSVGILNPKFLQKNRKFVVLVVFILAALITPPDVTTQILVAFPMLALFEISLILCRILFRKKLTAEVADLEEDFFGFDEDDEEEEDEDEDDDEDEDEEEDDEEDDEENGEDEDEEEEEEEEEEDDEPVVDSKAIDEAVQRRLMPNPPKNSTKAYTYSRPNTTKK